MTATGPAGLKDRTGRGPAPRDTAADSVVGELTAVLAKALRALGTAGRPVQASRLGGRAWWILQEGHPREAERINGTMHYLARLPEEEPDATAAHRSSWQPRTGKQCTTTTKDRSEGTPT